jgi:hypothetical protein
MRPPPRLTLQPDLRILINPGAGIPSSLSSLSSLPLKDALVGGCAPPSCLTGHLLRGRPLSGRTAMHHHPARMTSADSAIVK